MNSNLIQKTQPKKSNKKMILTIAAIGLIGIVGVVAVFYGPYEYNNIEITIEVQNGHYEDPFPSGCQSDETQLRVFGISGELCAPSCTTSSCPTDVPSQVTASPQCILEDQRGDKFCALVCVPQLSNDAQCGDATCKPISGIGICTYDESSQLLGKEQIKQVETVVIPNQIIEDFEIWLDLHGKNYVGAEKNHRLKIYYENHKWVEEFNKDESNNIVVSLNKFADLSHEEFVSMYVGNKEQFRRKRPRNTVILSEENLPDSIDWRTKGAVTPVKDQKQCGSCWAFSATGAMEGANFIKHGKLVSLSEQQLVDCSSAFGNEGCNGGWMDQAFDYAKTKDMITEANYAYEAKDGTCRYKSKQHTDEIIDSYKDVTIDSSPQLKAAVAQQPVAVAIEADRLPFQFYTSGILKSTSCGTNLDHGVLAVGYGSEGGVDYWIVKNSWGGSWGESGYVRIQRNSGQTEGICGILEAPSYPSMH